MGAFNTSQLMLPPPPKLRTSARADAQYETFARPKETPMDLQGRPMVASATEGLKNTVIRDEEKRQ